MGQFESEAKNTSEDLKRKAYSKPRLQVFGDLRTIVRGVGDVDPTQDDAPVQHVKSQ